MQEDAVLVEWVATVLLAAAGARLLVLGIRSRTRCEWLLGTALLLRGGATALALTPGTAQDGVLWSGMIFASRICFGLGILVLAAFIRERFRVGERWANGVVLGAPSMVAAGIVLSVLDGDWVGWSPLTDPWVWLEWAGLTVPLVWLITEAVSRNADVRRRLRIGLQVADTRAHYRLLAIGALGHLMSQVSVLALYIQYESQNRISAMMDALVGGFDGLAAVTLGLAYAARVVPGKAAISQGRVETEARSGCRAG